MADKPKMATKYPGLYVHSWTTPKRGDPKPSKYRGVYRHKVAERVEAEDGTTTTREVWRTVSKVFDTPLLGEAHRLHEEWKQEQASRAEARPPESEKPVADYVAAYVKTLSDAGAIEASTASGYGWSVKRIRDGLPGVTLGGLTTSQAQEWERSMTEEGLSSSTVGKAHRVLKQACKHAVMVGDLDRSPMDAVRPPKRDRTEPNALDARGRARLVAMLDGMEPTPLVTGAYLALYAGMRQGEICGLRWRCVDLDGATIRVRESIGRALGGAYSKEPKTGGSRRDIPMTPALVAAMRRRRDAMTAEYLAATLDGKPGKVADLYAIGYVDGRFFSPHELGEQWAALSRACGLVGTQGRRCTFHDLRHTFATIAIAEGVDVKTVSSMLGHANAAMTLNIYADTDPDAKRQAAATIGEAMARPAPVAEVRGLREGTTGR